MRTCVYSPPQAAYIIALVYDLLQARHSENVATRSQAPYPRPPAELANLPPRQAIYNGVATPRQLLWQAANSLLHTGRHTLYLGHDGDLFVEDCAGTRTWSRTWPGEEARY